MNLANIKRILISFLLAVLLGIIYNFFSIAIVASNTQINYNIELWIYANDLFNLVYPIFSTIPFCWLLAFELDKKYLNNIHNRTSIKIYVLNKYCCNALFAGLTIFIISFSGLLIAQYIISPSIGSLNPSSLDGHYMGYYLLNHPILYGLVLSFWRAIIGTLVFSTGFILAFFFENIFVILTGPFIYTILENFITAIIGYPQFSLCTSFNPNRLAESYVSTSTIFIGVGILILFNIILITLGKIVRKEDCVV